MHFNDGLAIFFRWLHLISACLLIGSVFFFHTLLPIGTRGLDPAAAEAVFLRVRRGFKMTVHVCLLLFLISGTYNAIGNWHAYALDKPVLHGLFGIHLLLGLGGLAVLMVMLAGRTPRRSPVGGIRMAFLFLLLAVAAASTLKSAREWTLARLGPPHVMPRLLPAAS